MAANGYEYDLITIGAGSGGVRASRFSAANYGKKVAVIELPFGFVSSENVGGAGGTCAFLLPVFFLPAFVLWCERCMTRDFCREVYHIALVVAAGRSEQTPFERNL